MQSFEDREIKLFEAILAKITKQNNHGKWKFMLKRPKIEALQKFQIQFEITTFGTQLDTHYYIRIYIQSKKIYDENTGGNAIYSQISRGITKQKLQEIQLTPVKWLFDKYKELNCILNNMVLDKLQGLFYDKSCADDTEEISILTMAEDVLNADEDIDKCCCCSENTDTKTPCGHSICVLCWNTLENLSCPICREPIRNIPEVDVDED